MARERGCVDEGESSTALARDFFISNRCVAMIEERSTLVAIGSLALWK
jgi:hypothetical protein